MSQYYLNNNRQEDSGDFEVHKSNCTHGADLDNQLPLGEHINCHRAVAKAKQLYPKVAADIDGCHYCCSDCHSS